MSSVIKTYIDRIAGKYQTSNEDILAIEEPLEIRLSLVKANQRQVKNISVTMRTPGNDKELALGFLYTEGIIEKIENVISVDTSTENIIIISFDDNVNIDLIKLERNFYTTSSCGVCGKSSIEAIKTIKNISKTNKPFAIQTSLICMLPSILRHHQNIFEQTGGLHASAIFNSAGELILLNEDVGRHNALDKVVGDALLKNLLPLANHILLLSGRASFELIQKAAMAGIKIVASIGAPSSLAVELAKDCGMTLIGFLRDDHFNIYCGKENLVFEK